MPNYLLSIQYEGTDFFGWQEQPKGKTVQGELQTALSKILNEPIKITGGGRTDTGVHALGQKANFITNQNIDAYRFLHSLNAVLPFSISVNGLQIVPDDFSARYSATGRRYMYCIIKKKSPFYRNFAMLYHKTPEIELLNSYAELITGKHDFSSFTKNRKDLDHAFCTVQYASWKQRGEVTLFFIEANRFLHGMVRSLTGTMLSLASENKPPDSFKEIILAQERTLAGASADAKGLFLLSVNYPGII